MFASAVHLYNFTLYDEEYCYKVKFTGCPTLKQLWAPYIFKLKRNKIKEKMNVYICGKVSYKNQETTTKQKLDNHTKLHGSK